MGWLGSVFGARRSSAALAKQRLESVLAKERAALSSRLPEYLPILQRELQLVVAKYVHVPPREVSVRIGHSRHAREGQLEVRIELPQAAAPAA